MSNEITTKITNLYQKGITDNYTNPKWWKNKWIVFDYGHFKIMSKAYIEDMKEELEEI